jgi:predicted patatin/cPLA2 family phospholipase
MRIALVVEGGGMRGAYPGGMAHALAELGLQDAFDVVYGTSAGAFVAVGFVSGQSWGPATVFHRDLACREFIDPKRAAYRQGPLLSLDFLIDDVMEREPFNWDALLNAEIPVHIMATSVKGFRGEAVTGLRTPDEYRAVLRASACIPFVSGTSVPFRGESWIDGSVADPLPVSRAIAAGATHVLSLLSRPRPLLGKARWEGATRMLPAIDAVGFADRRTAALWEGANRRFPAVDLERRTAVWRENTERRTAAWRENTERRTAALRENTERRAAALRESTERRTAGWREEAEGRMAAWWEGVEGAMPEVARALAARSDRYAASMRMVIDGEHPGRAGAKLLALAPARDCNVRALTVHGGRLKRASDVGYGTVCAAVRAATGRTVLR